jgi:hypothetical protein
VVLIICTGKGVQHLGIVGYRFVNLWQTLTFEQFDQDACKIVQLLALASIV